MNRREFARLLALSGTVPFVTATPALAWPKADKLPPTPASPDEKFWGAVRDQFVMPPNLTMLNAANLCPSSGPVLETLYSVTKDMDQDPSPDNRAEAGRGAREYAQAARRVPARRLPRKSSSRATRASRTTSSPLASI